MVGVVCDSAVSMGVVYCVLKRLMMALWCMYHRCKGITYNTPISIINSLFSI